MSIVEIFEKQIGMMLGMRQMFLKDVSDTEATWQPKPEVPSIAWHVAHTQYAEACSFLGSSKGDWSIQQKPWGPLVKMGAKLPADLKVLPKLSQMLADRAAQNAAVLAYVKSLSDAQRGAVMSHMREGVLPPMLQSVNDCLGLMALHDSHHNGEISLLRRMLGKPGVI